MFCIEPRASGFIQTFRDAETVSVLELEYYIVIVVF